MFLGQWSRGTDPVAESLEAIAATHPVDPRHAPAALSEQIKLEAEGQCGCGGCVLRAWRLASKGGNA